MAFDTLNQFPKIIDVKSKTPKTWTETLKKEQKPKGNSKMQKSAQPTIFQKKMS